MPVASSSVANKTSVVRGLITEMLQGKWQAADRLTEAIACERFNVSRTPVREAFFELQGLGLIEIRRNCGVIVLPFGPKQLQDIYAVRTLLEVEATRLAASQANREQVDAFITEFTAIRDSGGEDPDWRHDRELHTFIAESSGNSRLASEIARYGSLIQTMREVVGEKALGIHTKTAEDHLAILAALRRRSSRAAAEAMRLHLEQASESAIAAVEVSRANYQ